jgi:hypothetical protein
VIVLLPASDGKMSIHHTTVELVESAAAALQAGGLRTGTFAMTLPDGHCGDCPRFRHGLELAVRSGIGSLRVGGGLFLPCADLSLNVVDMCLAL